MRENRTSGLEGGEALPRLPYPYLTRMPGNVTVTLPDCLGRALAGPAPLEFFRMFAAGLFRAGMVLDVTVALSDLLRGAFLGLSFQILRLLTTFRSFTHRTILLNGETS